MPADAVPLPTRLRIVAVVGADDEPAVRRLIAEAGCAVALEVCADQDVAVVLATPQRCDVVVLAARRDEDLALLARLRRSASGLAVVVLADEAVLRERAMMQGAQDGLTLAGLRADLLSYVLLHAAARASLDGEMRARQTELRALFDLNPHPMWVYDAETLKFLAVNQVAIRDYGYSEKEFLGMTIADIRSPTEVKRLQEHIAEGLPRLSPAGVWLHRRKDGSELEADVSAQAVPLWGRNARLVQARNVTYERRALRALEASERRFRDLFEHSTGYICMHDMDGMLLALNPAAAGALGYSSGELLGTLLHNVVVAEWRAHVDVYLQRIRQCGEDAGFLRMQNKAGDVLIWQYRNRLYHGADGSAYVIGYAQDITALRTAERALERSEHRLRAIADSLPLKIAYLDTERRFVFANEAYRRDYLALGDITGMYSWDVLGEARYARRRPFLDRAFNGERMVFEDEEGEGENYACVEVTFIPEIADPAEGVAGVHAMVQDVTAKKREEKRLIRLARMDSLTGLLNRAGFYERLDNALARSRDQDSMLALLYLDIDHFKEINDTHGHAVGDALIRAFAARLSERVRASDIVARLGGDEFTVIIEGMPDVEDVKAVAAKLITAMRRPFEVDGEARPLSVGTSIGIALCRAAALSTSALVARADAMLYEAKQAGRGTFRIAPPDGGPSARRDAPAG